MVDINTIISAKGIDKFTVTDGDFNTLLSETDPADRKAVSTELNSH